MTVRLRASVIPGWAPGLVALTGLSVAGLALTGCASQGTIGAAGGSGGPSSVGTDSSSGSSSSASSSSAASAASSAPASGSSPSAPVSQDPSALASSLKKLDSLWTDQGCKTGLAGFSDYLYAQQASELQGVAAIPGAVQKIRAGAQQTQKPQAAQAMNKMAADLQTMFSQAQQGQTPDKGPVKNDFQIMGNVCSQP